VTGVIGLVVALKAAREGYWVAAVFMAAVSAMSFLIAGWLWERYGSYFSILAERPKPFSWRDWLSLGPPPRYRDLKAETDRLLGEDE